MQLFMKTHNNEDPNLIAGCPRNVSKFSLKFSRRLALLSQQPLNFVSISFNTSFSEGKIFPQTFPRKIFTNQIKSFPARFTKF